MQTVETAAPRRRATAAQRAADQRAFDDAVWHAENAQYWRDQKHERLTTTSWCRLPFTAGQCEAKARHSEKRVREIALQSEILLAQRARQAQGGAA